MEENSKDGSLRDDMSEKCKILKIRCNCDHDDDDWAKTAPLGSLQSKAELHLLLIFRYIEVINRHTGCICEVRHGGTADV
jgi:phosphate uptake regulator